MIRLLKLFRAGDDPGICEGIRAAFRDEPDVVIDEDLQAEPEPDRTAAAVFVMTEAALGDPSLGPCLATLDRRGPAGDSRLTGPGGVRFFRRPGSPRAASQPQRRRLERRGPAGQSRLHGHPAVPGHGPFPAALQGVHLVPPLRRRGHGPGSP